MSNLYPSPTSLQSSGGPATSRDVNDFLDEVTSKLGSMSLSENNASQQVLVTAQNMPSHQPGSVHDDHHGHSAEVKGTRQGSNLPRNKLQEEQFTGSSVVTEQPRSSVRLFPRDILVENIDPVTSEEDLRNYLETWLDKDVDEVRFSQDNTKAVVTLAEEIDLSGVGEIKRLLKERRLLVSYVEEPGQICVRGLRRVDEVLPKSFQSPESGNVDKALIADVKEIAEDIILDFKKPEVVKKVVSKKNHKFEGQDIFIEKFYKEVGVSVWNEGKVESVQINLTLLAKRFLMVINFAEEIMFKKKNVKIMLPEDNNDIVLAGPSLNVQWAKEQLSVYLKDMSEHSKTINLSRNKVKLLDMETTGDYLMTKLRKKGIQGAWECSQSSGTVKIVSLTTKGLDGTIELLEESLVEKEVDAEGITEEQYQKIDLELRKKNLCYFVHNQGNAILLIASDTDINVLERQTKDLVEHCLQEQKSVKDMRKHKVHDAFKFNFFPKPPKAKFLISHMQGRINRVAKDNGVKIDPIETGFGITGKEDDCRTAREGLRKLADNVKVLEITKEGRYIEELDQSGLIPFITEYVEQTIPPCVAEAVISHFETIKVSDTFTVHVVVGDTSFFHLDAIMVAVDENINPIGSFSTSVHAKGGLEVEKQITDYLKKHGALKLGQVCTTSSGDYKGSSNIIHARFLRQIRLEDEEAIVCKAVEASLFSAESAQMESIGISTLVIKEKNMTFITRDIVKFLSDFLQHPKKAFLQEVFFCCEDKATFEAYSKNIKIYLNFEEDVDEPEEQGATAETSENVQSSINVQVIKGDLSAQQADVIVNSVDETLILSRGAISKSLLKVGGEELEMECAKKCPAGVEIGNFVDTRGTGRLRCFRVYHCCLPFYWSYENSYKKIFKDLIMSMLNHASKCGYSSIAFPSLGTGLRGYTAHQVAPWMFDSIRLHKKTNPNTSIKQVKFVIHENDHQIFQVYKEYEAKYKEKIDPSQPKEPGKGSTQMTYAEATRSASSQHHLQHLQQQHLQQQHLQQQHLQQQHLQQQHLQQQHLQQQHLQQQHLQQQHLQQQHLQQQHLQQQHLQQYHQQDQEREVSKHQNDLVKIEIVRGKITDLKVDVIVNSSNPSLDLSRGAVSQSILKQGGHEIQEELRAKYWKGLNLAGIAVSGGGKLKCKKIYHTCLPQWDVGDEGNRNKVMIDSLIWNCMKMASDNGSKSIAFPAFGTGKLGYPRDIVADTMYYAVDFFKKNFESGLERIYFVVYEKDKETLAAFDRRHQKYLQELSNISMNESTLPPSQTSDTDEWRMNSLTVKVKQGNILSEPCDTVVMTLDSTMYLERGSVSRRLQEKPKGVQLQKNCYEQKFSFNDKGWIMLDSNETCAAKMIIFLKKDKLATLQELLIYQCLQINERRNFKSLAFPILATGQDASLAVTMANDFHTALTKFVKENPRYLQQVTVVVYQKTQYEAFRQTFSAKRRDFMMPRRRAPAPPHHPRYVDKPATASAVTKTSQTMKVSTNTSVVYRAASDSVQNLAKAMDTLESFSVEKNNFSEKVFDDRLKNITRQMQKEFGKLSTEDVKVETKRSERTVCVSGKPLEALKILKEVIKMISDIPDTKETESISNISKPQTNVTGSEVMNSPSTSLYEQQNSSSGVKIKPKTPLSGSADPSNMDYKPERYETEAGLGEMKDRDHCLEEIMFGDDTEPFTHCKDFAASKTENTSKGVPLLPESAGNVGGTKEHVPGDGTKLYTEGNHYTTATLLHNDVPDNLPKPVKEDDFGFTTDSMKEWVVVENNPKDEEKFKKDEETYTDSSASSVTVSSGASAQDDTEPELKIEWFLVDETETNRELQSYDIMNSKIESAYRNDEKSVELPGEDEVFVVNFDTMEEFVKGSEDDSVPVIRRECLPDHEVTLPGHLQGLSNEFKLVLVDRSSEEFDKVNKNFLEAAENLHVTVVKIEKMLNGALYKNYERKKEQMKKSGVLKPGTDHLERTLWHGPLSNTDTIINLSKFGFNRSYCRSGEDRRCGDGVYFYPSITDILTNSMMDASGHHHVCLSKVLTGRTTVGHMGLRQAPKSFHSVIDSFSKPSKFAVFFDNQALPEYLVTFTVDTDGK